jgi:O-antigen ligase
LIAALAILCGIEGSLLILSYALSAGDWERTGLYLLAITAPLEVYRTPVAGVDISLFRLSLLFAVGVLLVTTRSQRRGLMRWVGHPLVAAYLLLAGVFVVGTLAHPIDPFLGWREASQIGTGVVALVVIAEFARRESAERVASAIVVGSVLPILGVAWVALAPKLGASEVLPLLSHLPAAPGLEVTRQALSSFGPIGARAKGTFGDPNHFGVYLVFAVCLAFALTVVAGLRGNRRAQVSFGAVAVAAAATLVATFSRSAWTAAVISVLIIAIWLASAWRVGALGRPKKRVAALVIIGALALGVPVAPSVVERVAPGSAINVISDRTHMSTVRFALDQFSAHPVLGIGPGGVGVKLLEGTRTSGAHSTYLTVAAELGILGLLALLLTAAVALRFLVRACRARRGTSVAVLPIALTAAYVGFLGASVTYDIWWDDFHWLILGAIVGIVAGASAATAGTETDAPSGVGVHDVPDGRGPCVPVVSLELLRADIS